jgi:DNA-binding CsgD family transcriptional regulator
VGERSLPLLPTERALVQTFGLTSTEARVARLVATGQGLDAAAHELGVSRNTVRTHLARVFGKTGTKRQAELTSILHSAFPPVRDPSNRRG